MLRWSGFCRVAERFDRRAREAPPSWKRRKQDAIGVALFGGEWCRHCDQLVPTTGIDGPVVVVTGRIAALLVMRTDLGRLGEQVRGSDPEADAVLLALTRNRE